jgi:hypothetical protein
MPMFLAKPRYWRRRLARLQHPVRDLLTDHRGQADIATRIQRLSVSQSMVSVPIMMSLRLTWPLLFL